MKVGKPQGIAAVVFGLILLTGGVLVLINVPSWGRWIADYPQQLASAQVPPEATSVVQGMRGAFGPLLEQGGGYIQRIGYFVGSLLTIVSLGPIGIGAMLIKGKGEQIKHLPSLPRKEDSLQSNKLSRSHMSMG